MLWGRKHKYLINIYGKKIIAKAIKLFGLPRHTHTHMELTHTHIQFVYIIAYIQINVLQWFLKLSIALRLKAHTFLIENHNWLSVSVCENGYWPSVDCRVFV